MIETVLATIREQTRLDDLRVVQEVKKPGTARAPGTFRCEAAGEAYLLIVATNACQNFYLQRSIRQQEIFARIDDRFELNPPVCSGRADTMRFDYALYKHYSPALHCESSAPVRLLEAFYERHAQEAVVTDELVEEIKTEFLRAWPGNRHHAIVTLREFEEYFEELRSLGTVKLAFEHGDFTNNNILRMNDGMYLTDFEFTRNLQPIGFDIYDYSSSLKQRAKYKDSVHYHNLHVLKYVLINRINTLVDSGDCSLLVLDGMSAEIEKQWAELYQKGGHYNLSPSWCREWLKHFGAAERLHLITYWKNSKLVLLAPFYVREQERTLTLIGAGPDLYDRFGILYEEEKYLPYLARYLSECGMQVDLRFLDASSTFATLLFKHLLRDGVPFVSSVIDTKPSASHAKLKGKERSDAKRCMNRAMRQQGEEVAFQYDVPREPRFIQEFIRFHIARWHGGPFEVLPRFREFIENLYYNSDIVCLSRLYFPNSDVSIAYHLGYTDSAKVFWSSIPSYDVEYSELSPGKVLMYFLVQEAFERGVEKFDFGRGAEAYKYWFSNEDTLLLNVEFPRKPRTLSIIDRIMHKCARTIKGLRR